MLWEQSVAMNREKGRPFTWVKPPFFSEKWNPEEIREVQEEVKMAVGKKKAIRDFTYRNPTKKTC